ncbi:MAG: hypothetical protein JSW71_07535, partial [Gemmatimonadota bacterium]
MSFVWLRDYPGIRFIIEFLRDLGIVLVVDLGLRLFNTVLHRLHEWTPASEAPQDIRSYLPLEFTRTVVTVFDAISIVAVT